MVQPDTVRSIVCLIAGGLWAIGWWLLVDAAVWESTKGSKDTPTMLAYFYIPGIVGTVALIMINIVPMDALNPTSISFDDNVLPRARLFLMVSLLLCIGSMIGGIWIMAQVYLKDNKGDDYPGIAIAVQNFLIFLSSMTLLFGRRYKGGDEYAPF
mmetsp:Transcript_27991/g.39455  ORF Transcript_27991/g.39455 Transcript_27991/m.39455 type:complete len:155 (-) Transcript_27991:48-512(-)